MIKGRDIIVVGLQSLDSKIGSNCVNIANEFAKNNRVLYINYAPDRFTLLKHKKDPLIQKRRNVLRSKEDDLVQVNENMWNLYPRVILESINQIGSKFVFDYLNKKNSNRFIKAIKKSIQKLDFRDYIIFNDSDFYRSFYLKENLKPALYVYYTRDNMVATSYFRKHGLRYESKLMEKADLITANSIYLQMQAKKYNSNSHYVGQGCDLSLFMKEKVKSIPADLQKIPKPIIGYIGALKSSRLDIDLLVQIAEGKPDIQLVLVGPEDEEFKNSKLHTNKNVHFLGSKKIEELPSYLAGIDIAINPQLINELTIGNYPRKIDEYLAMGVPVLATKTEAMQSFKDHVYLAEGIEEYLEKIELALKENSPEKEIERIRFAQTHTWENSVNDIYKAINATLTI